MYSFHQPITPAAKSHMDAQLSFFTDISKTLFQSIQKINNLNTQLAHALFEESTRAGHQILTADKPENMLAAGAAQAQPIAEKIRTYQQHLTQIAAESQVDLSKCAEQHIPETSRTAKVLAEEVVELAAEENEKIRQHQQDTMRKISDSFEAPQRDGARAAPPVGQPGGKPSSAPH